MDDFHHRITPWAITLVLHNWPILICLVLLPVTALRAYLHPTRPSVLTVYGILTLAFAFEYQKHAPGPVDVTLEYVFYYGPVYRQIGHFLLIDVLPLAVYVLGFAFLLLSLLLSGRRNLPNTL